LPQKIKAQTLDDARRFKMTSGEPKQKWFDENGEWWHDHDKNPGEPNPKEGLASRGKSFAKGFLDRLHLRKPQDPFKQPPPF